MKTTTIKVSEIQVGDVIMPPERELRLWMRKHAAAHGWSENALALTVTEVGDGLPDKGGPWVLIRTVHDPEWVPSGAFKFKARPWSDWKLVPSGGELRKAHMDATDEVQELAAQVAELETENRRLRAQWVGVVPDIFGYGMSVLAPSKEAAMKALRAEYKRWKKQLGKHADPTTTFDRSFEEFGGRVAKVEVGKVYYDNFGE